MFKESKWYYILIIKLKYIHFKISFLKFIARYFKKELILIINF